MAFVYEDLNNHYSNGICQSPSGQITFENMQTMLDDRMLKDKITPIMNDFVTESLDVNKGLQNINSNTIVPTVQTMGGRLFRVKQNKRKSKYF